MKGIRPLPFVLAIALGTITALAPAWFAQAAYAASTNLRSERTKARAECDQQANQRKFVAKSIRRRNFLRECMRDRGFAGLP
jgi:hypothetical protein